MRDAIGIMEYICLDADVCAIRSEPLIISPNTHCHDSTADRIPPIMEVMQSAELWLKLHMLELANIEVKGRCWVN